MSPGTAEDKKRKLTGMNKGAPWETRFTWTENGYQTCSLDRA